MKQLKVFSDPKQFWLEVSPHLKKEEAKNSLCLGLSYLFTENKENCIYQSALFNEQQQLLGSLVLSRYRTSYNLLPSPVPDLKSAEILFNEFKKSKLKITGIIGEQETATFYKNIIEKQGFKTNIHMAQGLYRCSKVKMPILASKLTFRKAEEKDIITLGDWINTFHAEAVPHDPPINGVEHAKNKIENNMIYIVEKSGEIVSMAGWSRDIESSVSINLVFTPKHLRKNGYASVVTAKLTQHMLSTGKNETALYTDMTNPTSNKIYMNVGYEFICNSVHYGVA